MSSSSSNTLALREAGFIGDVMRTSLDYLQENEGESSHPKTRNPHLRRNHEVEHNQLVNVYIVDDAVYAEKSRRRFRMSKVLLLRIVDDINNRFPYFQQQVNGRGQTGFSRIQNSTAAIHQLASNMRPDSWDEYLRMSEQTTWDCV
ncbi:uncharacterized protein LOC111887380 [Lactuca sativa]|uniref:uncharacterized protein LOC111887380 n=1 Tax=Lactuca sativa TaxID=4236 RepID=UPI000CD8A7DE|nr:uncharacterized protein LOC111887380 [Lactuca sativa]